jgi:hypothetical protein
MGFQHNKHYSLEEATELLPKVRIWLDRLAALRKRARRSDKKLASMIEGGADVGGDTVNNWLRTLVEIKTVIREFQTHELQLKDVDRGLVDFPSIREGREVFLCWEKTETDIEHWHEMDEGYGGRRSI